MAGVLVVADTGVVVLVVIGKNGGGGGYGYWYCIVLHVLSLDACGIIILGYNPGLELRKI